MRLEHLSIRNSPGGARTVDGDIRRMKGEIEFLKEHLATALMRIAELEKVYDKGGAVKDVNVTGKRKRAA